MQRSKVMLLKIILLIYDLNFQKPEIKQDIKLYIRITPIVLMYVNKYLVCVMIPWLSRP